MPKGLQTEVQESNALKKFALSSHKRAKDYWHHWKDAVLIFLLPGKLKKDDRKKGHYLNTYLKLQYSLSFICHILGNNGTSLLALKILGSEPPQSAHRKTKLHIR